jgi:tetratricopeptide (TPR) repeat protein
MKNPVERRLEKIEDIWSGFAQDQAIRVLQFEGNEDDVRLLELFLEMQMDEGSTLPDLILRFSLPFQSAETYGNALAGAFRKEYQSSAEELSEDDLKLWNPPPVLAGTDVQPHDNLIVTLDSFCSHFSDLFERVALVLTPDSISDMAAFHGWMRQVAELPYPEAAMAVLIGLSQNNSLLESDEAEDAPTFTTHLLDLDGAGALEELAKTEGAEGPGKAFRLHFLAIGNAGKAKNPRAARRSARDARKIAREQGWVDQEVVIHLALGSALLSSQEPKEAAKVYSNAVALSQKLMHNRHPGGEKLVLTSLLSEGAAWFSAEDYRRAAVTYQKTGIFAGKIEDHRSAIDAWRMASYCHAETREYQSAWDCGVNALDAGEYVEPPDREDTTLAYAGDMLLRMLKDQGGDTARVDEVGTRMTGMLGPDWRESVEAAAS